MQHQLHVQQNWCFQPTNKHIINDPNSQPHHNGKLFFHIGANDHENYLRRLNVKVECNIIHMLKKTDILNRKHIYHQGYAFSIFVNVYNTGFYTLITHIFYIILHIID